jgi:hypothetical protein
MTTETLIHAEGCEEYGETCATCARHSCTDRQDSEMDSHYGNLDGSVLCGDCWSQDLEHASTCLLFDPSESEPQRYLIGDHVGIDHHCDDWDGATRVYHRTDPWRGYYETEIPGTTEIQAGADLYGEETDVRSLAERIQSEHKDGTLPVPVWIVIDLTSNVFATAMSVRVDDRYLDTFRAWIDGTLYGEED